VAIKIAIFEEMHQLFKEMIATYGRYSTQNISIVNCRSLLKFGDENFQNHLTTDMTDLIQNGLTTNHHLKDFFLFSVAELSCGVRAVVALRQDSTSGALRIKDVHRLDGITFPCLWG
jgi:hypothetical protein